MMRIVTAFFALFVVLTVVASACCTAPLWGAGSWASVSLVWCIVAAAAASLLLRPGSTDRLYPKEPGPRAPGILKSLAFAAAAIVVLWFLRSNNDIWGERSAISRAIESGALLRPGSPLATLINWSLYRLLSVTFLIDGGSVSSLLSVLAGICFLAAARTTAGLLHGPDGSAGPFKSISTALILANGFSVLFFATGGNTPLAVLSSLLFTYTALLYAKRRTGIIVPSIALALSLSMHMSNLFLLPGFIYMVVVEARSRRRPWRALAAVSVLAACWAAVELALTSSGGPSPSRYLALSALSALGGSSARLVLTFPARLLSSFNELLFIGPAAAAAVVLLFHDLTVGNRGKGERDRAHSLLVLLAGSALVFIVAASGRLEQGIRWDILASTGPVFAVYTISKLARAMPDRRAFHRAAVLITAIGVFHTLPLLIINASIAHAERWLLAIPMEAGRGESMLGDRALENGDLDGSMAWYSIAVEKNPSDGPAFFRLANVCMEKELYAKAITNFTKALKLDENNSEYRLGLAESFISKQWYDEAIEHLEILTSRYPQDAFYWRRLGFAMNHGNYYDGAIAAYRRALAVEPGNEENLVGLTSAILNKGNRTQEEGELDKARELFKGAINIYPQNWVASHNLAMLEAEAGDLEEAHRVMERAIEMHPHIFRLNFSMALLMEKLGRTKEAIGYFRRCLEINPAIPDTQQHINRLEKKLQRTGGEG